MRAGLEVRYATRRWVQFNPLTRRRLVALVSRERSPAETRAGVIEAALRATLEAAAERIPAYRGLRGRIPDAGLFDFLRQVVPITTKEDLQHGRERFYPNHGRPRPWWSIGRTSGTTGSPLAVFRSVDSVTWEHAVLLQHWGWAGLDVDMRQVVLRGDVVVPPDQGRPPYWFHDRYGNSLIVSTRHLTRDAAQPIAEAIRASGAKCMRAYPSAAYELAKLNLELGRPIRFESVIASSETLYPFQREAIESAFGAQVFSGYGMAERVIYGSECEHGRMHLNPEYGVVEIVDKSGRATNHEGLLVGTTLHNRLMPLLRYQLKDSARWDPRPCPCGRTYPVIQDLTGKIEDLLFDLDGQPVSPSVMTFAFKQAHGIQRAQVAQIARDRWIIRIVPDRGYTDAVGAAVLSSLHRLVSARVRATVECVSTIPELPNGKYKWVSQEWAGASTGKKS